MTISVLSEIGPRCSERIADLGGKDGGHLRATILQALKSSEDTIIIDLDGVLVMTPSFADEAFGKLLYEVQARELKQRLRLLPGGADPVLVRRIQTALRNREEIMKSQVGA